MSQEHFEHMIEQIKASIAHDEVMSAMLRAHAAQDKQMLDLIQVNLRFNGKRQLARLVDGGLLWQHM